MNFRRLAIGTLAAGLLLAMAPEAAPAQTGADEYRGAAALGLQLRRLGTTKRVLMIGAHPDDEDTQLLARFALEEGAEVAYLSLTRGEGGQNGIGPELGEGLGLLRTEELLAARRVDGARQFFTRAYDFGFSKSAEEAFRHWPREEVLGDVVSVIHQFRPDIIITVFSGTPRDGHGHHQVSAILAREAFAAVVDSVRFPGTPWPAKLYQSLRGNTENATVRVPIGNLDPLIGRSPFQLAMASRSRHRSQDMGRPELPGPRWGTLLRVLPEGATGPEPSIWAGIDTTLALDGPAESTAARALERYQRQVEEIRARFNPLEPRASAAGLLEALGTLWVAWDSMPVTNGVKDLREDVMDEILKVQDAAVSALGLVIDGVASDARLAPGQVVDVEVTLWNGGLDPIVVDDLSPGLNAGRQWSATPVDSIPKPRAEATVAPGTLLTQRWKVHVPEGADPTEPYFLREPRRGDLYYWEWDDRDMAETLPFERPPLTACATGAVNGQRLSFCTDVTYREVDLRQGELRRPVMVVPAVSVLLDPPARVLSTAAPRPITYTVRLAAEQPGGISGTARLEVPAGWRVEPASAPVRFDAPGQVREVRFTVTAPANARPGDHPVSAVFIAQDGQRFERGVQMIDYPHVRARPLYHDARSVVRAVDLRVPQGLRVAYIEGAGEEGPGFLANLGITPELLDAEDLAEGDLDRFDVIIAGSRAYEVRTDLMAHNRRLLEWVSRGGTMIVQYNKHEIVEGNFTPFPMTIARPHGRVTDENAPVMIDPAHPVFTTPNRIAESDWTGWVQERGLYFAETWDPAFTPVLETGDPGETPLRGGLLIARHGRGTYVYTGLAFFRQFPQGVPGAYRLFANLLALGAK
jgi:LmbE family N-acetylglucosaminyl deacetylase